ncbi:MAG TPA: MtrB/PioB family decaheme-associated outer membrane protein, partial [Steroidobacteraceae bacterium]|nr:MtrB/PioB family decaheme-associated outer membrane protein [Steroidobacteraceae bacterium]
MGHKILQRDSSGARKLGLLVLPLALIGALPISAVQADGTAAAPDLSKWLCTVCPTAYGWSGVASLGIDGLTSGNYRYGEYSGYNHSGAYADVDGALRYREKDGEYFDAATGNLGVDSRWIELAGGTQGLVKLQGFYRQIPQLQFDTGQSPMFGFGSSYQSLPPNWVAGGATSQMTALAASLQPVNVGNQRHTVGVGAEYTPRASNWDFAFDFRDDLQSGNAITGANILTDSTQLAAPIDYRTNQFDASAAYSRERFQARLGYYGSFFTEDNSSFEWSNPFASIVPGATEGRMSLPPSNSFQQLALSGGWQILPSTRFMTSLAVGREQQDAAFLPATVNSMLTTAAMPAGSLDARVNTGNYLLRLNSTPMRHLSINAEYLVDRRDNATAQNAFQQVVTDAFIGAAQTNLPYSFDRNHAKLNAAYRMLPKFALVTQVKLQLGVDYEQFDRSFQTVIRNHTGTAWAELNSEFAYGLGLALKYSHSQRKLDDYMAVAGLAAPENPLLQQFNTADRSRQQWLGTLSYAPTPKFMIDVVWRESDDSYQKTIIGLKGDDDHSATLDLNWMPTEKFTVEVHFTHELIETAQAGSQSFSVPDWFGGDNIAIDTVGAGLQWRDAIPKLDLGLNYNWSYSNEATSVSAGVAAPGFPENAVRDLAARLWSRYHLNERCALRF